MQIDLDHLHHWMRAIRNSKNPMRTMDAFWRGQILSKEWLIDNIRPHIVSPVSVDIHGGWVGVLASMLFQSALPIKHIRSIDIDPDCEDIARDMNQIELEAGKFRAITADMCMTHSDADVIINTSCEHITQDQYDLWVSRHSQNSLLVLQSNNYDLPDHVRTAKDLKEFKDQCQINVLWAGELDLPLYKRFMVVGRR